MEGVCWCWARESVKTSDSRDRAEQIDQQRHKEITMKPTPHAPIGAAMHVGRPLPQERHLHRSPRPVTEGLRAARGMGPSPIQNSKTVALLTSTACSKCSHSADTLANVAWAATLSHRGTPAAALPVYVSTAKPAPSSAADSACDRLVRFVFAGV